MSDVTDDTREDATARGGIQALDAALFVLRTMATFAGPVALSDLARAAGMPASKVHRYLASFIHAGLVVQRSRSGRYDLGPFATEFGLAALGRNDFVNRTANALEELCEATGLTVLLAVWADAGATVVRWERAASPILTSFGLGSTFPLLTSASGRIFLAYLPRRLTASRLQLELERARQARLSWPDLDLTDASVESLVARIRNGRLASVDGGFIPGLKAISAPVTNWQGEAELAVTLIGTHDDLLSRDSPAHAHLQAFTARFSIPNPSAQAAQERR